MLVNEFLEQSAKRFSDKTALVCEDQRLTFLDIENLSNRLAHGLLQEELQRQERAAVFFEPSSEAVVSIFAILKAGGVFLVINPQVKAKKVEYIFFGGTVILERSFIYPYKLIDLIIKEKVTGFPIVPTIAANPPMAKLLKKS